MSNIPKEPGLYPIITYDPTADYEKQGIMTLTPYTLERGKCYVTWEEGVTKFYYTEAFFNCREDISVGPKIEFPKGGWRNK